jgi:hypothetical protein
MLVDYFGVGQRSPVAVASGAPRGVAVARRSRNRMLSLRAAYCRCGMVFERAQPLGAAVPNPPDSATQTE